VLFLPANPPGNALVEGTNMRENFNWNDETLDVVEGFESFAAYENENRDIVIRQKRDWSQEDDHVVVIPRQRVGDLIAILQKLAMP
jgi:hypothetical protein